MEECEKNNRWIKKIVYMSNNKKTTDSQWYAFTFSCNTIEIREMKKKRTPHVKMFFSVVAIVALLSRSLSSYEFIMLIITYCCGYCLLLWCLNKITISHSLRIFVLSLTIAVYTGSDCERTLTRTHLSVAVLFIACFVLVCVCVWISFIIPFDEYPNTTPNKNSLVIG